ncbi:MAG: SCO family protein, partial [Kiloniellales bacterium]|nr:SCO family protein [Kiloniellales bacterium]
TLLYFGYTFCPDFCPAALQTFSATLDQLGEDAGEVQSFFISVDPERDTPEALADYVAHFHEQTRAASGPKDKIDAVARAFRVYYALRKDVDPVDYPVDHSTFGYLMDRDWKLVAVIRHDASPEAIAAAVRQIL